MKKWLPINLVFLFLLFVSNLAWSQVVNFESIVSSLAGSESSGAVNGTGAGASFYLPNAVATDAAGNVYVADQGNNLIRKITALGVTTTLAGSGTGTFANGTGTAASFFAPSGLVVDGLGNVYVADAANNRIRMITPAGVVTTFAGSGTAGFVNGTGTAAQFNSPRGITMDGSGNFYVADLNNRSIRKITAAGVVTTLAGSASYGYLDETGSLAQFASPMAVVADAAGNVFVADWDNHRIRKVTSAGVVTTLAGSGIEGTLDGTGTAARFGYPAGLATDAAGNIYVSDNNQHNIRKVTPAGVVTTLAGSTPYGFVDGASSSARFYSPRGIAFDANNNLYIADYNNHKIRKYKAASLDFFADTYNNFPPVHQSFIVSGSALTANLVITAPTGYLLSDRSPSDFNPGPRLTGSSLTFAPVSGTVSAKTIYVYFSNVANVNAGNYSGNITVTSTSATTKSLPINGTLAKANQVISTTYLPDPLPVKNIGDAPFEMYASANSSLDVTYTSSNTAVATVSGNVLTVVGGGTCNITIKQAGNVNYNAAPDVVVPFTVTKISQSITFNTLANKTVADGSFVLTATASSGLAVSYTSSNPSVATIVGNTVTIVGIGTANITASQAGNGTYKAATNQAQALQVTIASQTLSFTLPTTITKLTGSLVLNGTASSGLAVTYISSNTAVATVSGSTLTFVGVGSTTITASQAGNSNYSAATSVAKPLEVTIVSQTISFTLPSTITKLTGSVVLNGTASSGLAVTYVSSNTAVATVSGTTLTLVGAGSTTITASQAGNSNYSPATSVTKTLEVTIVSQSISFTLPASISLATGTVALNGTASSGLAVTYVSSNTAVATVSGSTLTFVGIGSTIITASQAGDVNYSAATSVLKPLEVTILSQTISFTLPATITRLTGSVVLNGTASSGLAVNYVSSNTAVATVSGSTLTFVGIGSTTITASQSGNSSYSAATSVAKSLEVTIISQSISFTLPAAISLATGTFDLNGVASSGLTVSYVSSNTAVATVSGSTLTFVGSGITQITASQAGDVNYSAASNVVHSLEVNAKLSQVITFDPLSAKTVGAASFALGATSSEGFAVSYTSSNTSVATVSGNVVTIVGAGNTDITASQAGNDDFNPAVDVVQSLLVHSIATTVNIADSFVTKLFPNPSIGILNIEFRNGLDEAIEFMIVDMQGRVVSSVKANGTAGKYQLDVSGLNAGMYRLELLSNQNSKGSYLFVKQ